MQMKTFHARVDATGSPPKLDELVAALTENGLVPALRSTFQDLDSRLSSAGLPTFPRIIDRDRLEILIHDDGLYGLLLRLYDEASELFLNRMAYEEGKQHAVLDVALFTRDQASTESVEAMLERVVNDLFSSPLSEHSLVEVRLIERLQERFGDLSPNGRILQDERVREACRRLYDDGLRTSLAPVVNTFGLSPTPRAGLLQLDLFASQPQVLDNLLKDQSVVKLHYSVFCSKCNLSQLAFEERDKAQEVITMVDERCGACGERKLTILDTYAPNEAYVRALQQGLWLESLVADILEERTNAVWVGQMAKRDEFDVIGVYADEVVVVECKDTSLGSNDTYITAAKAENVGAGLTIIVTTREVHQNVQDAISEMSRGGRDRRVEIIAESNANDIRSRLNEVLDKLPSRTVRKWMADGIGFPFSSYRRPGLL